MGTLGWELKRKQGVTDSGLPPLIHLYAVLESVGVWITAALLPTDSFYISSNRSGICVAAESLPVEESLVDRNIDIFRLSRRLDDLVSDELWDYKFRQNLHKNKKCNFRAYLQSCHQICNVWHRSQQNTGERFDSWKKAGTKLWSFPTFCYTFPDLPMNDQHFNHCYEALGQYLHDGMFCNFSYNNGSDRQSGPMKTDSCEGSATATVKFCTADLTYW